METEVLTLVKELKATVAHLAGEVAALREENARLTRETAKSVAALRLVKDALCVGERKERPWDRLSKGKVEQVMAVIAYLRAHPTASVNVAVERSFVETRGGYTNVESLKSWCYRKDIPLFC